ncbi:MAG: hypothetical protein HC904_10060 [Blastochloris sp.]|nr:hypothetical protein [Blastochloris sp.]
MIWVDGKIEHCSQGGGWQQEKARTGQALRQDREPGLQVLAAECRDFYQPDFDVESIRRSSALVEDKVWVVVDEIEAASSHEFTWQLVLRQGARATDYGARLHTAEQVVLDVIHLDAGRVEWQDMPGYPSSLENPVIICASVCRVRRLSLLPCWCRNRRGRSWPTGVWDGGDAGI